MESTRWRRGLRGKCGVPVGSGVSRNRDEENLHGSGNWKESRGGASVAVEDICAERWSPEIEMENTCGWRRTLLWEKVSD
ncbi:hypothetical protein [Methanosarcina sp. Kolksee]|uniref:hypothetical protein n=1 Tax=Methanosarcina sp. Kolksee TaxID=1434099 RepID=UPI00064ED787|nr:hypothetical protein [Methanosarcina sp. Kolksee]